MYTVIIFSLKKVRNGYHKLVRLGYNREALPLYKEHANMLRDMARAAVTPAEKHEFYIQVQNTLKCRNVVNTNVVRSPKWVNHNRYAVIIIKIKF